MSTFSINVGKKVCVTNSHFEINYFLFKMI